LDHQQSNLTAFLPILIVQVLDSMRYDHDAHGLIKSGDIDVGYSERVLTVPRP
jgi:hypothetical protein